MYKLDGFLTMSECVVLVPPKDHGTWYGLIILSTSRYAESV